MLTVGFFGFQILIFTIVILFETNNLSNLVYNQWKRTNKQRKKANTSFLNLKTLLISTRKPHKAVGEDTVGRWIKCALSQAGIDTSVFCAHSTRSASTSAAHSKGAPIDVILKAANWKNANTFEKFYHRLPDNTNINFSDIILNSLDTNDGSG